MKSPQAQRRAIVLGALGLAGVIVGLVFVLLPNTRGGIKTPTYTASVQTVQHVQQVPVTHERRAAIDALFDRFVPAAVARRDPGAARALVTPSLRAQATTADWQAGTIPVPPFDPRGTSFHGWRTVFSYPTLVSVELTLEPRRPQDQVTSFSVDVKRLGSRWLVDSIYQLGTHGGAAAAAPPAQPTDTTATRKPGQAFGGRLGAIWFLVPLGFLSLIIIVPALIFTKGWLEDRRVSRRYRNERKELPPLPRRPDPNPPDPGS